MHFFQLLDCIHALSRHSEFRKVIKSEILSPLPSIPHESDKAKVISQSQLSNPVCTELNLFQHCAALQCTPPTPL